MQAVERREWVILEQEGQQLFGVMHRPTDMKNVPAVLFLHGFTGNKVGHRRQFIEVAEELARQGIAAFRFDYRGCGDSQGHLYEQTFRSNVEDALLGMDWLLRDAQVDASRVGVLGRSMGGAISVQVASKHRDLRSMCLWSPVCDNADMRRRWRWFTLLPAMTEHVRLQDVYYHRDFIKEFFEEFFEAHPTAPLSELGHIPLMHVHAELDRVVTQEHLEEYRRLREGATAPSEWLVLPNSDHGFVHPEELEQLVMRTVHWFKETL